MLPFLLCPGSQVILMLSRQSVHISVTTARDRNQCCNLSAVRRARPITGARPLASVQCVQGSGCIHALMTALAMPLSCVCSVGSLASSRNLGR